jgi:hypothetical protein
MNFSGGPMPYIEQDHREVYNRHIKELVYNCNSLFDCHPGHLNYIISKIMYEVLTYKGVTYTNINALMGILNCVSLELYGKVAAPYEDKKEEENGTVYGDLT